MSLNEAETRAELIDPALREAGWGVVEGNRVCRMIIHCTKKLAAELPEVRPE